MQPVIIKHSIIKSDRVDLTVLPCSGKLKRFEEEGDSNRLDIEWYGCISHRHAAILNTDIVG
jgi:hypothetical protein